MCFDSSAVRREKQPAKSRATCRGRGTGRGTDRGTGRGIGRGTRRGIGTSREIGRGTGRDIDGVSSQQPDQQRVVKASISTGRQKRTKTIGFGIYTNASGSQTFNVSVYIILFISYSTI